MKIQADCERIGHVWLRPKAGGTTLRLTARCKTWGCAVCRTSLLALFRARLEAGVLALGRCALITVTYRANERVDQSAAVSRKEWAALLRKLKPLGLTEMKWFKVTELTKAKIPHYHVVIGPVKGRISCYGGEFDVRRYKARMDRCQCLSHVWGRAWRSVTGDSYICHAGVVKGPNSIGWYLGKYLQKGFREREDLEARGFKRRWSSSRGWPGSGRIRLARPYGGWQVMYVAGRSRFHSMVDDGSTWPRVGKNLTLLLAAKRKRLNSHLRLERLANVTPINRA